MIQYVFQDWHQNSHELRMRIVLIMFRFGQFWWRRGRCFKYLLLPYSVLYRLLVFYIFHIELSFGLDIGPGLRIYHGYSLVIHPQTRIGAGVTLRHCTTIGNKQMGGRPPVIEDNVEIGAGAYVLGDIRVGQNAKIGAGSIVTRDVQPFSTVVGNPAHVVSSRKEHMMHG